MQQAWRHILKEKANRGKAHLKPLRALPRLRREKVLLVPPRAQPRLEEIVKMYQVTCRVGK